MESLSGPNAKLKCSAQLLEDFLVNTVNQLHSLLESWAGFRSALAQVSGAPALLSGCLKRVHIFIKEIVCCSVAQSCLTL